VITAFADMVSSLHPKLNELLASPAHPYLHLPRKLPDRGVYLFSEGEEHLYVGRSNSLRRRISAHCSPGSDHRKAAFAFRVAREATGRVIAAYKPEGSRSNLAQDPEFSAAFTIAKQRIARMSIRHIEEPHPVVQALLEIYISMALKTKYNDFENH
jgi:hypothetical protein